MAYIISFRKKECIGAGDCARIDPKLWSLDEGRAALKNAKLNPATGAYELIIHDEQVAQQSLVAGSCPALCIEVKKQ